MKRAERDLADLVQLRQLLDSKRFSSDEPPTGRSLSIEADSVPWLVETLPARFPGDPHESQKNLFCAA